MGETLKQPYISYGLGHCKWKLVATCIFNKGVMISHKTETKFHLRWSKGQVIKKSLNVVIHLVKFDICSLKLEYVS